MTTPDVMLQRGTKYAVSRAAPLAQQSTLQIQLLCLILKTSFPVHFPGLQTVHGWPMPIAVCSSEVW